MNKNRYISRNAGWIILLVLAIFSSCKQEVVQPAGRSGDALISFFGVSPQMASELSFPSSTDYVLTDRTDTNFKVSSLSNTTPAFNKTNNFQYPGTGYNATLQQPWVQYMHMKPGLHTFALVDTARYLRVKDNINLKPNMPLSIYYADSMGYYRSFILQDQIATQSEKTGIRFLDFSPDAGSVFFTINEKPASQSGFPATLQYGQSSKFISYPNAKTDTLRINFYMTGDSTDVVARAFLQADPAHSYTLALTGYYNPSPVYKDPKSGSYIFLSGGLSVIINKNN